MEPVRINTYTETGRGSCNPTPLGNPATHCGIGLQDHGPIRLQQLQMTPSAGLDLTSGHRNSGFLSQQGMITNIIWAERLLNEVWVVRFIALHLFECGNVVFQGVIVSDYY